MQRFFSNIKYKILGVLFVAVLIISYIMLDSNAASPVITKMESASLPVVMMKTPAGTLFNELHGYTSQIDKYLINDSLTPLQDNRHLNVVINRYGENINKLSYKVRAMSDMALIEDTEVMDYTLDGEYINAVFKIKNLIESDTEYMLEISIATDKHESVNYYTKILYGRDINIQDKLRFIIDFNSWTFSDVNLDKITEYIETNSSGDNTNYGKVNINSSRSQIGWGDLKPVVETQIIPSIKEMTGDLASVSLGYKIAIPADEGVYNRCNVNEYYRIRQSGDKMYLLNFEREADQIFDSRGNLMESSRINLGISSEQSAHIINSEKGRFTCFVRQAELWCFDDEENVFVRVFSFGDEASDGIREDYGGHNIKVMEVDNDGNIYFIVYGYMNRGEHEGEVGVSLCRYEAKENQVNELIYIPVSVPYEVLSQNVGEVAYIGYNGAFYILLDNSLYSIDITSKEKMTEISGLTNETYSVSEDGTAIAYSINGELYNTDEIRIFNMATGSDHIIKAEQGDKLRVLGYIKNDLAYGRMHSGDLVRYKNGGTLFPMYCVEIADNNNQVIKHYETDGIYVSDASVEGMRLTLERVIKNEDGDYEAISTDQLINREENIQNNGAFVEVVTTESRKKELYIDLVNKVKNVSNVSMKTAAAVSFAEGEGIRVDAGFADFERYYVYGYGKFQGSFTSLERAINAAAQSYGTVKDPKGRSVWRRYKPGDMSISGIEAFYKQDEQSFAGSLDIMLAMAGVDANAANGFDEGKNAPEIIEQTNALTALNLQGVSLDNILSCVGEGRPVVGRYGPDRYVVIKAYDSKNVKFYDTAEGKEVTQTIGEASKLFEQWGNIFITYIR